MRILVFSDSHGQTYKVKEALRIHPEVNHIIFLGDGEIEMDLNILAPEMAHIPFTKVCGNNDYGSMLPVNELVRAGGKLIFCTHGHYEAVRTGVSRLAEKARSLNCDIALYGHTHVPFNKYIDGLYIMNPGTAWKGEYGIIDIINGQISINTTRI